MIAIFAIAICAHMYIFSATVDLLDVVVLIAIIGIVVDLPIHMILHYQQEREIENREKATKQATLEEDERVGRVVPKPLSAVSTALDKTNRYMRLSLFQLLILTLISGIPLLFATFLLLQKTGQYIVIIAIASYGFTVLVLPYLLALGCQTNTIACVSNRCCPNLVQRWSNRPNLNADTAAAPSAPSISVDQGQTATALSAPAIACISEPAHNVMLGDGQETNLLVPVVTVISATPIVTEPFDSSEDQALSRKLSQYG